MSKHGMIGAMPRIRAFISSTYEDLKAHRAYVIDRLRTGGIDLDPMENWTAASDAPKQLSQDRVKDCDVCILLIGFRLGYVPEGEVLSITQMEYAEAIRQGLEVLVAFLDAVCVSVNHFCEYTVNNLRDSCNENRKSLVFSSLHAKLNALVYL